MLGVLIKRARISSRCLNSRVGATDGGKAYKVVKEGLTLDDGVPGGRGEDGNDGIEPPILSSPTPSRKCVGRSSLTVVPIASRRQIQTKTV